ncbi:MAG: DUF4388 domain-containing protein [Nitrospiria bacterium]
MSLEGRLDDLGLPDIFQIINLSRRSGVLTLIKKDGMGRIVFNQGNVVYASSDAKSRFGYTLLQKNLISRTDLERALGVQKARSKKTPIGTLLVEIGAIAQDLLEVELRAHILDVVRELLTWTTGTFQFNLGKFAEEGVLMRAGISAEFLLLEGARLDDEADPTPGLDSAFTEHDRVPDPAAELGESTPMTHLVNSGDETLALRELISDDAGSFPTETERDSRKDLMLLPAMIEELSGTVSGQDVVLMMLRFAGELMNRAVMFVVRGATVTGWGQLGVSASDGSADERIRGIAVPLIEPSAFREVIEKRQSMKARWPDVSGNRRVIDRIGGEWPAESLLIPVVSNDRVVALLYGDNASDGAPIGDTEGLEAFIRVAGAALGQTTLPQQLQKSQSGL